MPFIPLPNGIKVCLRYKQADQNTCNVFYVTTASAVTDTLLDTIGTAVKNWWIANMKPGTTTNTSLEAIELTDWSTAGGLGIEYTTGLPSFGTDASAALPNNATLAVKLGTGLTGRSNRGRQYVTGIGSGSLAGDKNHISTAAQTAFKAAYDALISDMVSAGVELVIASFFHGVDSLHKPIPRTTGVSHPVASVSVNTAMDSQRRRLPERGN
jgi:hypothetical protein